MSGSSPLTCFELTCAIY